ncbi:hypothetical protein D3C76_573210 [compost metagenome]
MTSVSGDSTSLNSTGDTILGELEPQYFNIEAGIAKATNNDGLWEAELSSIININQETESAIHLVVSVNKLSEDRYQLENIKGFPKEQEIQLKKGESFYYNETVDGLSEGQYEASFKVISEQDKDYIWANQEQLYSL